MQHVSKELEEYISIIKDLTEVLGNLTHLEETKAEAASLGYHDRIDGLLKDEQAMVLKIRGLEQKRFKLQESLGWGELSFRDILSKADAGQAAVLSPLFTPLEEQVKSLSDVRDSAQRIITLRLREFASVLTWAEGQTFDDNGDPGIRIPAHFHDTYV